jgi:hypothetical protein
VASPYEDSSIGGKRHDQVSDSQLFKKDPALWGYSVSETSLDVRYCQVMT